MADKKARLFYEDWSSFAPGAFPYDPEHSAMGEYHYYPSAGNTGLWYDPIVSYSYRGPSWLFVERDGALGVEQMRVSAPGGVNPCPCLVFGDKDWRDCDITAQMMLYSTSEPCGLLFRYQTSLAHYGFFINGSVAELVRTNKFERTVLARAPFEAECCELYELSVSVNGGDIACSIDGNQLLTANDGAYDSGCAAIAAYMPARFGFVWADCTSEAISRLTAERAERHTELERLRGEYPQPKLHKIINLEPFGAGRQIRFGHLTGTNEKFFVMAQSQKRVFKDRYARISCLTAVSFETGDVLWQRGTPVAGDENAFLTADLPFQIYDIDGDGIDEVIMAGDFELMILDGPTGAVRKSAKTPLNDEPAQGLPGIEFKKHAFDRLNVDAIRIINVSGNPRPSDILIKDRYARLWVYDGDLNPLWRFTGGNTGHFPYAHDFDGDGRDEIVSCYNLIDSDGRLRWSLPVKTDHVDEIIVGRFAPGSRDTIAMVAGWEGFILADPEGGIIKRDINGHGQRISCAPYRPDLPGYQIACSTYWGNQGIIYLYDCHGNELWHYEPGCNGNIITPVNWHGGNAPLLLLNTSVKHGGMLDGFGRKVVVFPDDGHPELCAEVADVTGDSSPEIITWDTKRMYIYTQHGGSEGTDGARYMSYPEYNASNYRGEYLFETAD